MNDVLPNVGEVIGSNGATVLKVKQYSDLPGDCYLGIVLALFRGEFVTWIYNAECAGCVEGHYFQSLEEAMVDYEKRGE